MNRLARHMKLITLFLSLVYACSLTGMGSVVVWLANGAESQFFFLCKGNGCHCDQAGRELLNCRCDRSSDESEDSCCSEPQDAPLLETVVEDSYCSTESSEPSLVDILQASGCGGIEDESALNLLKHSLLKDLPVKSRNHNLSQVFNSSGPRNYSFCFTFKLLKIPIALS